MNDHSTKKIMLDSRSPVQQLWATLSVTHGPWLNEVDTFPESQEKQEERSYLPPKTPEFNREVVTSLIIWPFVITWLLLTYGTWQLSQLNLLCEDHERKSPKVRKWTSEYVDAVPKAELPSSNNSWFESETCAIDLIPDFLIRIKLTFTFGSKDLRCIFW